MINKDPNATDCPAGMAIALGTNVTGVDNVAYVGQIDYVTRISRTYSRWFGTGANPGSGFPHYSQVILEPSPESLPDGTSVILAFRGADAVSFTGGTSMLTGPDNATSYDEYGEPLAIRNRVLDNMETCGDTTDDVFTTVNWRLHGHLHER